MEKQKYDRIKTRKFVSQIVDFPVISTKDKIISTAEDSKTKSSNNEISKGNQ